MEPLYREVVVPYVERRVPVIADERVEREFGTGALKVTPGHDPLDFEIGRDHGLPEPTVVGPDGVMNDEAGDLAGLTQEEAGAHAHGYQPVFAGDAIAAINQAPQERPDLILLDLALPAGDVYLVMERLKAMPALEGTPVIVVRALDPQTEEERLVQSGADAFFRKPFDYEELLTAIGRALGAEPAA